MTDDMAVLVTTFISYLEANDISPNSKQALKLQHAFVLGANTLAELVNQKLSPALLICAMAGRPLSSLGTNPTIKGKVGEGRAA
jgi:hypothetical protein